VSPESAVVWREQNRDIFAQTIAAAAEQLSTSQLAVVKVYLVCQALLAIEERAGRDDLQGWHQPGEAAAHRALL
jgi:hypothetical protein